MVVETKTLLLTPAVHPIADMQYQSSPPHTFFPSIGRLRRTHLGPYAPDYHPWSSVATFDTLQIAPGSVVGACIEEELETIVTVSDKL